MRRKGFSDTLLRFFQRGERWLIRGLVLASVLLVIFQLGLAGDPVQLYLTMAKKVESPALPIGNELTAKQYTLTLKVSPSAAVKLIQNGQIIASLDRDTSSEVLVSEGQLIFDARGINQLVRVQILAVSPQISQLQPNQIITLQNNSLSINIVPPK